MHILVNLEKKEVIVVSEDEELERELNTILDDEDFKSLDELSKAWKLVNIGEEGSHEVSLNEDFRIVIERV